MEKLQLTRYRDDRENEKLRATNRTYVEENGKMRTKMMEHDSRVKNLDTGAKKLQISLDQLSRQKKEAENTVTELKLEVATMEGKVNAYKKEKDQALLDAKRALQSADHSTKMVKAAQEEARMAVADREKAFAQMEEAVEKHHAIEKSLKDSEKAREEMMPLKQENARLLAEIHKAHEQQTQA